MAHEVRGVVAMATGEPVTLETIVVPDPGPGEALVAVQARGVCHTDTGWAGSTPTSPRSPLGSNGCSAPASASSAARGSRSSPDP